MAGNVGGDIDTIPVSELSVVVESERGDRGPSVDLGFGPGESDR